MEQSNTTLYNDNLNRYEIQDNAFFVTFIINFATMLGTLLLFCFLRSRFPLFFNYRYEKHQKGVTNISDSGWFGWIFETLNYDNKKIIDTSGLDGYMYLKNVKSNLYILSTLLVLSSVVLYSTNSKGQYNSHRQPDENGKLPDKVIGLTIISMSNIERGSNLLWVHVMFTFIVTLVVWVFSFKEYKAYCKYRVYYKKEERLSNYTMILRDIPMSMFNKDDVAIYFKQYLSNPDDVKDVCLQYPAPHIYPYVDEREFYIKHYEAAIEEYNRKRVRPTRKSGPFGLCGKRVDSIDYYKAKYEKLTSKIEEERSKAEIQYEQHQSEEKNRNLEKAEKQPGGTGFIVFNQKSIQKQLVQTVMHKKLNVLFSHFYAPDPNDIYWGNIHIGMKSYYFRQLMVIIATFVLIFFWTIPVTFISGFSNLGTLSKIKVFSWLVSLIEKSPLLVGFLQGYLPNLALILFMALLIPIIKLLSILSGYISKSRIEQSIFSKYYLFLVFNVFLVSAIAGTIFQSLEAIINNPPSITSTLANALGGLSFQMINFVLLAGTGLTMNLLRLSDLIINLFKLKFLAKTKREIDDANKSEPFKYGKTYAYNLLILQVCLAYSTLAPFILLFGVMYFSVNYLVSKYNIAFVNTPAYQSGGQLWPMSFRRTLVGLLIYHLLMVGTFNIYQFYYGILVVIPFILTICFWGYVEWYFYSISKNGLLDTYQIKQYNNIINQQQQQQNQENNNDNDNNYDVVNINESQPLLNNSNNILPVLEFNDNSYSIIEYNENLYKPPYYNKLMQPEEFINPNLDINNNDIGQANV
ncbi:hypothetical protein DICPUDRAFT_98592 [Dictyostelium purpureum]|uniref:CSC1/OSCA1-like 7TM region domain-containing protein n=1 Tax=Dictyostelium purpureum TaxID=5786 RepID=F0ZRV9_DICPU|nr:uncharacterized protein DICPUDRAFT_98592 [Dictyostelium purpureum]EGC33330.1 hypothetical protein DICPUDRAFT_98592 [Dictyostelium purpureum]|eukprot:XP_003290146.1 hypothetical protein DICPUDRAFT_98592 [Dictyostelium purpureum]